MQCKNCGYDDNFEEKFLGIFANGTGFSTTDGDMCGLFGCPKCHAVQFVTDIDYIKKRKEMYKKQMKNSLK